ncbi:transcriptional regulator HexR [Larsenimonas rhizosphaerae]|uniref:Transcriptional regulator HexR n=1 Tax=Larsenimonas rhizosphaerae TaxID=2944682 RepID=A0AA41ZQF1_9GAMM|nr:transcriptional regulator HexR [Larsenimonas rhizosphaerae]MCM2131191.1 transcriptional regulator HexR [Larsenimonas rhizosphaerae]MCX2525450.1 transcriptional regulator HexR [Larsenimonas rhizosphaerae]
MSLALFDELRDRLPDFRRSEQKVARYVLRHPDEAIHMRIADIAKNAGVSEPTVIRFCRALGCDGFQDFKLRLAQMLATGAQYAQFSMDDSHDVGQFTNGIFDSTIGILLSVRDRTDPEAVSKAIQALTLANRVEFYGFGASGAVASDAQHKFFRLQVSTAAYADPHMQNMSAVTLSAGDVVVAISQTGRTSSLLSSVDLAREAGATVIGLCPRNSPLANAVNIPLFIDVREDSEVYTPMTSRIVHLVMIDILAVGVAKSKGSQLDDKVRAVKRSLAPLRVPEGNSGH